MAAGDPQPLSEARGRQQGALSPPAGTPGLLGDNHKARWHQLHQQALFQAQFDGRFNGHKVSNEARTVNSFGANFLTDAFSAGHLVNKPTVIQFAREHWDKVVTTGSIFKETPFTKAVSRAVLSDPGAGPKLRGQQLKLVAWGDIDEQRFSEFLRQVAKFTNTSTMRSRLRAAGWR